MKFIYFNDTNRIVNIHPATFIHGCTGNKEPIKPLEERIFILPNGTYPWVKMWDYNEEGLSILISPVKEIENDLSIKKSSAFWDAVDEEIVDVTLFNNRVNADKLFVSLIIEFINRDIDPSNSFTISQLAELIPRGTAGINNYATYGFSFMSMLSGQKDRDYFIFNNKNLRDEFTLICNNNHDRDNYHWKKYYLNEVVKINNKYIR